MNTAIVVHDAKTGEIVDNAAVEIGRLYERARTSIVDSVRYQIECGRRLAEKKASLNHGEWLPWLEANAGVLGFTSDRTARMLMQAAGTNRKPASDLDEDSAVQISRKVWGHKPERPSPPARRPAAVPDAPRPARGKAAICQRVREAISALSGLPPAGEVVDYFRGTDEAVLVAERLPVAMRWLSEFSDLWPEEGDHAEAAE